MTGINQMILRNYYEYLIRLQIKRRRDYFKAAKQLLEKFKNMEILSQLNLSRLENMYGDSSWKMKKAKAFYKFLKANAFIVDEKGILLNKSNPHKTDYYFDRYIQDEQISGKAYNTVRRYKSSMITFFDYTKGINCNYIRDISTKIIENYKEYLYVYKYNGRDNYTAEFQSRKFEVVKLYFRYLYKKGYIAYDPAKKVKINKVSRKTNMNYLEHKEMNKIFTSMSKNTIYEKRNYMIMYTGYFYGLRVSEVSKLNITDIDFNNNYVYINNSKGNKDRVLPLIEPIKTKLDKYINTTRNQIIQDKYRARKNPDKTDALFLSQNTKSRLCGDRLEEIVKEILCECGITKKLTFHFLRSSFATALLKNGMGLRYIQKALGHRSIDTTAKYLKVITKDLKKILEKYHPHEIERKKYIEKARVQINADI